MGIEQRQLLAAEDGIRSIADLENDAVGRQANRLIIDSPMRASARHDGAFSSRDKIGCDIRSQPVSGRHPQASLNAGSKRSTSRSSQSS